MRDISEFNSENIIKICVSNTKKNKVITMLHKVNINNL